MPACTAAVESLGCGISLNRLAQCTDCVQPLTQSTPVFCCPASLTNPAAQVCADPKKTLTVMLYDNCDKCSPDQINLQALPFKQLAPLDIGRIGVQFREVRVLCMCVRVCVCVSAREVLEAWHIEQTFEGHCRAHTPQRLHLPLAAASHIASLAALLNEQLLPGLPLAH